MPMPVIRKHKRGNLYMNATFDGKRETIYGKTEEEVEKKYIKRCYEAGLGIKTGSTMTVEEYLRTWLSLKRDELSPYTYTGYKVNIEKHVIPIIGKAPLKNVLPADIQRLFKQKREERKTVHAEKIRLEAALKSQQSARSPEEKEVAEAALAKVNVALAKSKPLGEKSLLYVYTTLYTAFGDAVSNSLMPKNPIQEVKPPKVPKKPNIKNKLPDEDPVKLLFDSVYGKEYELGIHLAVACGLRRGEICAVQKTDMNFETHILTVQRAMDQTKEFGIMVKLPKDDDIREVFVPTGTERVMMRIFKQQEQDAILLGGSYEREFTFLDKDGITVTLNNFMVRHRDGTYYTPHALSSSINGAIKRLDFKTPVTLHGLRHVFVSLGYKHGADAKAITDSAGHYDEQFNRERYQSVYDEMKQVLADKLNDALYTPENKGNDGPEYYD